MFSKPLLLIIGLIFGTFLSNSVTSGQIEENASDEKPATNNPRFLSEGREIQVREGSDLELPCQVEDLGEFVILWKFNRTQVLFAGNLRIHRDDRINRNDPEGSLIIRNFQLENAGEYSCQISTNPPQDIIYLIKVIAPPQIKQHPESGQVTIKKGDPINLNCELSHSPAIPTQITWKKVNDKSFNERQELNSSQLYIPKANRNDAGTYECIAINQIGETASKFVVRVLYSPEVEIDEPLLHAPIGQPVEIACMVHAEPSASLEWFRSHSKLFANDNYKFRRDNSSATLKILKVSREDYGNYSCVANNTLGSAVKTIEVTGKPSKPRFTSPQVGNQETSYELFWTVHSEAPIKSYDLRIREANQVSDEPGQWQHLKVDPKNDESGPERHQSYNIEDLSNDKNYEIDLAVENDFGITRSEIFSFVTSSALNSPQMVDDMNEQNFVKSMDFSADPNGRSPLSARSREVFLMGLTTILIGRSLF